MDTMIVVTSTVPVRRRAGVVIEGSACFPVDHFTAAELRELLRDPVLRVTIGQPLAEDGIEALLAGDGDGDEAPAEGELQQAAPAKKGGRARA